jgi:hypothetical protein
MKKIFLALLMLGSSIGVFAQSTPSTSSPTPDKGAILGYSQFNIKNIEKNTDPARGVSVYGDLRLGYLN